MKSSYILCMLGVVAATFLFCEGLANPSCECNVANEHYEILKEMTGELNKMVNTTNCVGLCSWRISAPQDWRIVLKWGDISIETCICQRRCFSSVNLYDGANAEAYHVGHYCGLGLLPHPKIFKSSGSDLFLQFEFNLFLPFNFKYTKYAGFNLSYEMAPPLKPKEKDCGGFIVNPENPLDEVLYFQSPNYNGEENYGLLTKECKWDMLVGPNKHIQITFHEIDLEDHLLCSADNITVYSSAEGGDLTKFNKDVTLCGKAANFIMHVNGRKAQVWFRMDSTVAGTGFIASWMEVDPDVTPCGMPDHENPFLDRNEIPLPMPRIINGHPAVPHSSPWMVTLQRYNRHQCGGSLISPTWVVTAGHCVQDGLTVVAGAHHLRETPSHQIRNIKRAVTHPEYLADMIDEMAYNDIALLELDAPVSYSHYVRPICFAKEEVPSGTSCETTGWGLIHIWHGSPYELQQVTATLRNATECVKDLLPIEFVPSQMVCAEGQGATPIFKGDSGGPLACYNDSTGAWDLYGITSWFDHRLSDYAAFVRVISYLSWIEKITGIPLPKPTTDATPATKTTPATPATKTTPATPATETTLATPATKKTPATPATKTTPATVTKTTLATPATKTTPATVTKTTPATPATKTTPATPATKTTPATPATETTPATHATKPTLALDSPAREPPQLMQRGKATTGTRTSAIGSASVGIITVICVLVALVVVFVIVRRVQVKDVGKGEAGSDDKNQPLERFRETASCP